MSRRPEGPPMRHRGTPRRRPDSTADQESAWWEKNSLMDTLRPAAIESVRQDPPDLIISDLQLEDADGLEMIARLKVILPNVPVILLTGVLFDQEVVSDVLKTKVACYLAKTSSLTQILESVRRLLG